MFRDHLLLRLLIVGRKGNTCFAFRRPALLVEKPREKPRAGCMARGGGGGGGDCCGYRASCRGDEMS